MSTINFGKINGRRCVSFAVSEDGRVPRSGREDYDGEYPQEWIPARESFRRWKIARKAWRSRKNKAQTTLTFSPH